MTHLSRQHARTTDRRLGRRLAATTATLAAAVAAPVAMAAPAHGASDATWNELAQCESSGDWHINTGNGYYGGLQFSDQTWDAFGGEQYAASADDATRSQQIDIAEEVLATQGWGAWPACSAELGLDRADAAGEPSRSGGRAPVSNGGGSSSGGDYTVQSGDTLSKIAREQGISWRALWQANDEEISDPHLIFIGQELDLP
jgi:resuscitation-promoting factor RpfA